MLASTSYMPLPTKIMIVLTIALSAICLVRVAWKAIKTATSPVRSVHAVVADKHKLETPAPMRYKAGVSRTRYVVTFSAEGKKRSFYVSEFSYNGYRLKESGTLKYKGERLIDFS